MKKGILVRCVVAALTVSMLSGCIKVDVHVPADSQGQQSAVQNSQGQQSASQNSQGQGSSAQAGVTSSSDAASIIAEIESEMREMERLDEQLEDTLEFVLKGRELKLNEQVYFESGDKTIYLAGGSGEGTRSLAFLKEIYPELQISEKILDYTFEEAELHVSDNVQYTKVDAVPQGKKLGEVYTVEIKKANITSGSFDYKNISEDFEVKFFLKDSKFTKAFDDFRQAKEAIKDYGIYTDGQDDYILRWSNDKYTFFVEADSQREIDALINANISENFKM